MSLSPYCPPPPKKSRLFTYNCNRITKKKSSEKKKEKNNANLKDQHIILLLLVLIVRLLLHPHRLLAAPLLRLRSLRLQLPRRQEACRRLGLPLPPLRLRSLRRQLCPETSLVRGPKSEVRGPDVSTHAASATLCLSAASARSFARCASSASTLFMISLLDMVVEEQEQGARKDRLSSSLSYILTPPSNLTLPRLRSPFPGFIGLPFLIVLPF